MKLYEIIVPSYDNRGLAFAPEVMKALLIQIAHATGGFTALRSQQGEFLGGFIDKDGDLATDISSPMRVAVGSDEKLQEILALIAKALNQEAVMAYLISPEVVMYRATEA